jgi:hypothetical protein
MRLLMSLFATIGLLGMTSNLASKLVRSHDFPSYVSQSAPAAMNRH